MPSPSLSDTPSSSLDASRFHAVCPDMELETYACMFVRLHGHVLEKSDLYRHEKNATPCDFSQPTAPGNVWSIHLPRRMLSQDTRSLLPSRFSPLSASPCSSVTVPLKKRGQGEHDEEDVWPSFLPFPPQDPTYTCQRIWDERGLRKILLESTPEGLPGLLGALRLTGGSLYMVAPDGERTRLLTLRTPRTPLRQQVARAMREKDDERFYLKHNTRAQFPTLQQVLTEDLWTRAVQAGQADMVRHSEAEPSFSPRSTRRRP